MQEIASALQEKNRKVPLPARSLPLCTGCLDGSCMVEGPHPVFVFGLRNFSKAGCLAFLLVQDSAFDIKTSLIQRLSQSLTGKQLLTAPKATHNRVQHAATRVPRVAMDLATTVER